MVKDDVDEFEGDFDEEELEDEDFEEDNDYAEEGYR